VDEEVGLEINKVKYEVFEQVIKRFGYARDINLQSLLSCENECHLTVSKIEDEDHIQHAYFQHPTMGDHGRLISRRVLLVGLLFCKH